MNLRHLLLLPSALLLAGCLEVEDEKAIAAIKAINRHYQTCYEALVAEQGTRTFTVSADRAFTSVGTAMRRLGVVVVEADRSLGYLRTVSPAPQPLDEWEWRRAKEHDLPELRRMAAEHVGWRGWFIEFEPEGLNVVFTFTVIDAGAAESEVSVTMNFEEVLPPRSGYPRRKYPPCNAARIGLEKIWQALEEELERQPASA